MEKASTQIEDEEAVMSGKVLIFEGRSHLGETG
jgi:hypothetical protein